MSTDFSPPIAIQGDAIKIRARTERNTGLRVSAVYREIDGKQGSSKDETTMLSRLREEIEKHDENQDGEIDAVEMVTILRGVIQNHDQKDVLRKIIYGVVALVVLLVAATLGTSIAVATLMREISSDDNGVAGPALVSSDTGETLLVRPEGGSGCNVVIFPFHLSSIESKGESKPYRALLEIPAEKSPTGKNLQCAGMVLREVVDRAIENSDITSSPIRMSHLIEGQNWPHIISFNLPAINIEHVPDKRDPDVSNRKHLMEESWCMYDGKFFLAPYCEASAEMDLAEEPTWTFELPTEVDGKTISQSTVIYGRDVNERRRRLDEGRRRRRLTDAFANPLSEPWYQFVDISGPPSTTFVCNPDVTGNPALCFFCSSDTAIQPIGVSNTNTNMTTP